MAKKKKKKGRKRGDKIFDNSYNTGALDNIDDSDIEIDPYYRKKYLDSEYNMETTYRLEELSDIVYNLVKDNDRFAFILQKKKIIKKIVSEVLQYLLEHLDELEDYKFSEKFFVICNVLDLKAKVVYDNLPIMYRDIALDETMEYINVINQNKKTSFEKTLEEDDDQMLEDIKKEKRFDIPKSGNKRLL